MVRDRCPNKYFDTEKLIKEVCRNLKKWLWIINYPLSQLAMRFIAFKKELDAPFLRFLVFDLVQESGSGNGLNMLLSCWEDFASEI